MVAHEILVATLAVDLCCKAVSVSSALTSADTGDDDRESSKHFADRAFLQPTGHCKITPVAVGFELAIGTMTESVNHPFRRALPVEMQHLLSDCCVLEQVVSSWPCTERIGSIGFHAVVGG